MLQQHKIYIVTAGSAALLLFAAIYFIKKRKSSHESSDHNDNKKEKKNDLPDLDTSIASAAQSVVEVSVPRRAVGAIIGKDGSNIKQLRKEFGVRFNFNQKDPKESNSDEEAEEILTIRGEREKAHAAEQTVRRMISDVPQYLETEMFVPQEACGRIIGKGGVVIRQLSSVSGAKIVLEREENPSLGELRRVKLLGTSLQVDYAKALIEEKVKQERASRLKKAEKEKLRNPHVTTLPKMSLPEGDTYFQVFVSALHDPSHIWVQLVNEESIQLTKLDEELVKAYGAMEISENQLEEGMVGDLCIAPYEGEEGWYRGAITSINVAERTAGIFFVDYGDTCHVNMDQLKVIRPEDVKLPAHAIECFLPLKMTSIDSQWSDSFLANFKTMIKCAQWVPHMARVIGHREVDDGKCPILDLVNTQEKEFNICAEVVLNNSNVTWDETGVLNPQSLKPVVTEEECQLKVDDPLFVPAKHFDMGEQMKSSKQSDIDKQMELPKQDSFDDFIDIDVKNVNGELKAVLSEHHQVEAEIEISQKTENEVETQPDSDGLDTTLVEENDVHKEPKDFEKLKRGEDNLKIDDRVTNESLQNDVYNRAHKTDDTLNESLEHKNGESIEEELQRSLDETSRKNVFIDSMELARANPLNFSGDMASEAPNENDSFVSARSDITITDTEDTENVSFVSAVENLTPTNSLSSLSIPDLTVTKQSPKARSTSDLSVKSTDSSNKRNSKRLSGFEIQFIDESTHKVLSRESLNSFDQKPKRNSKIGKETTV